VHQLVEMLVSTEHEFAVVFDLLALAGPVFYLNFVALVADRCDTLKFTNARCRAKPSNDNGDKSAWKIRDLTWGNAANRSRTVVEVRMLG
jgi:hypothetical protein